MSDGSPETVRSVRTPPVVGYGSGRVSLAELHGTCVGVLTPRFASPALPAAELMEAAMGRPIGSPPLRELARAGDRVAILVSGKDRVTRADVYVPSILRHLASAGVPSSAVTIFMATGTHIRFTDADRALIFGDGLPGDVRVVAHDCRAQGDLTRIGTTGLGNEVWVNRAAFESEVKVLTGRITHHYFAGFTAGCKSVLPGVSGFETIKRNHRLVLSGSGSDARHPAARSGRLAGNPVHDEMLEAAAMFAPTFVVNTVLNTSHELTHVFCGDSVQAHEAGCHVVDETFAVRVTEPARVAVASCGGAPYDCSFMQALKTIFHAAPSVADDGVLLLLAACPEGITPGFLRWERELTLAELARTVLERYDLTGHNTYLLRQTLERIRVVLVSGLPADQVATLGLVPAANLEAGWDAVRRIVDDPSPEYLAVPFGNVTSIVLAA